MQQNQKKVIYLLACMIGLLALFPVVTGAQAGPPTCTDVFGAPIACPPSQSSNNTITSPASDDSDGDGTPNSADRCPNEPGPSWNNGCPVGADTVTDSTAPTPAPRPQPSLPQDVCAITVNTVVNVREKADPNAPIVGTLQPGFIYYVDWILKDPKTGEWLFVGIGLVSATVVNASAPCKIEPNIQPSIDVGSIVFADADDAPATSGAMPQTREHILLTVAGQPDAGLSVTTFGSGALKTYQIHCMPWPDCFIANLHIGTEPTVEAGNFYTSIQYPYGLLLQFAPSDKVEDLIPIVDFVLPEGSDLTPFVLSDVANNALLLDFVDKAPKEAGTGACDFYPPQAGNALNGYNQIYNQANIGALLYGTVKDGVMNKVFKFTNVIMKAGETFTYIALPNSQVFPSGAIAGTLRTSGTDEVVSLSPSETSPLKVTLVAPADGFYDIEIALSMVVVFPDSWSDLGGLPALTVKAYCDAAS